MRYLCIYALCSMARFLGLAMLFITLLTKSADASHNPDFGLDINQFLKKYGYPLETHEITTHDGYILTLHRISYGRNETSAKGYKKPVILVMHPLLSSSIDMVNLGPGKSIGLSLVDEGYDVWLGNIRGNTWSRRHIKLDPDEDKAFWDFSFEDVGLYDVPAIIDYILAITGHDKLAYLGHSQGTVQFFAMTTLRPEYNKKIKVMVAFAPVAYLQNVTQPLIRSYADHLSVYNFITDLLNINEFLPHTKLIPKLTRVLCHDGALTQELCATFIFWLVGSDSPQLNRSFLEVIGSNAPAGASIKMLQHLSQLIVSGHFRRFDYGPFKNLKIYKKFSPPDFNLSLITTPVALYYGGMDVISSAVNVKRLVKELPYVVENRFIDYFNHLDFIWAKDADSILYKDVIQLLNKYI